MRAEIDSVTRYIQAFQECDKLSAYPGVLFDILIEKNKKAPNKNVQCQCCKTI